MKKIILIIFGFFTCSLYAQQVSLRTQYLFDNMMVNAGATGSKDYIPINLNFRKQWTNFPGSPTTQMLSANGKIAPNFGFGGVIYNDVAGPSRITGGNINAAYHLRLDNTKKHRLGIGIGANLSQHYIDADRITTYLPNDPAVLQGYNNKLVPDVNFGVFYYFSDIGFAGISANNLVESRRDLFDFDYKLYNPLARTYNIYGGYNINFKRESKSRVKLSTLFQIIETGTFQIDLTALYEWNDIFWIGASYRLNDAVSGIAGVNIKMFSVGYSYDYTLSDIGKYSYGSHEIFLQLRLLNKKNSESQGRTPWLKRNRIYAPSL
ncbi:MAG: type IX secretion system membrane protein PorP/SprF [Brumimicrobium sp.]